MECEYHDAKINPINTISKCAISMYIHIYGFAYSLCRNDLVINRLYSPNIHFVSMHFLVNSGHSYEPLPHNLLLRIVEAGNRSFTRYVTLRDAHATVKPGPFSPPPTNVTHVPWCMSGSLTRGGGENVPGIPAAWATNNCIYLVRGPCGKVEIFAE